RSGLGRRGIDRTRCSANVGAHRLLARRSGLDTGVDRCRHGRLVQLSWPTCVATVDGMLEKIRSMDELEALAERVRRNGRKIVRAHGVFDILHIGHKRHLDIGKQHGDILIVTITTDLLVNKGPGRPIFSEKLRAEMLAGLASVDFVGISSGPGAEYVI